VTARTNWKTGKRGGACTRCEAQFAPLDAVVSALFEGAVGASADQDLADDAPPPFERADLCSACFDAATSPPPFCWWRTEIPEPHKKRATLDLQVAREFLVRLLDERAPERAPLRYLLALLLMRKRLVKVVEQFSDERGEMMIVRLPPDETPHEIECPALDERVTESLRADLGRLFDLGTDDEESTGGERDAAAG